MVKLPEFSFLAAGSHSDLHWHRLDQCMLGARTMKPTLLVTFKIDLGWHDLLCTHPHRKWVVPSTGERYIGPHPRLQGREWAVPEAEAPLVPPLQPTGPYLTRQAAAYPAEMCAFLAARLMAAVAQSTLH
eukprot:6118949-Amphidinium_carterae.1